MKATLLNFYGIRFLIEGPQDLIERLGAEFNYFVAESTDISNFAVRVHQRNERPHGWKKLFRTRRSALYLPRGNERRVSFFGTTDVAYRFESGECDIYGDDSASLFEVAYLVILSSVGEELDRRGLHRVHGMGLSREGRGILFLGSSGVGKSSLALEFLKEDASRLLSDDTPLVDESGGMSAFPQRIAFREHPHIHEDFVQRFSRHQFGEKYTIGAEYFKERIQPFIPTDAIVYLKRTGGCNIRLEALPRLQLFALLLRWLVVGHETPQIWQLYLRMSPLSLLWKMRIFVSRIRCAWSMTLRSRPWRVYLSDSVEASHRQLEEWIQRGVLQTRVPGEIQ